MRFRIALFAVVAALLSAVSISQEPSTAPPPELKKLEWMVGDWVTNMKWLQPGAEMEMPGTMKVEWDGQFLKTSSVMEAGPMKMTETQYLGWDAKSKKYVGYTFTNFAPTPRIERGDYDGTKLVGVSDPWDAPGMPNIIGRGMIVRKNDNEGTFTLEFKNGDTWTKVAKGTYKRNAN